MINLEDIVLCPACHGKPRSCHACGGSGIKELKTPVTIFVSGMEVIWAGAKRPCKKCNKVIGFGNVKKGGAKVAFNFDATKTNHAKTCVKINRWGVRK